MPSAVVTAPTASHLVHPAPGKRIVSIAWDDEEASHRVVGGRGDFWYMAVSLGANCNLLRFCARFPAGAQITVTWFDEAVDCPVRSGVDRTTSGAIGQP